MQPPAVDLTIGRSVTGWRLALALHIFANLAPLCSALGGYTVCLWPLAVFSLLQNYRRFIIDPSTSTKRLRFYDDQWQLSYIPSSSHQPELLPEHLPEHLPCELYGRRLVTPFLTILQFRPQNPSKRLFMKRRCVRVVIFADAVAPEPYRQLRVLLRLG